jgi:hypothetical protein
MMLELQRNQYSNARYLVAGAVIVLLLVAFPLAAAAGHSQGRTYSGDDAYDPAAGRFAPSSADFAVTFSGDDAYDPAARSSDLASLAASISASYSGDDAYDPAAGGLAAQTNFAFIANQGDAAGCELAGGSLVGIHSGDGLYDPASSAYGLSVC